MDINECDTPNICGGGICTNTLGSYDCTCDSGFEESGGTCVDIDECASGTPCGAGGICTNTSGGYVCTCPTGFEFDGNSCVPSFTFNMLNALNGVRAQVSAGTFSGQPEAEPDLVPFTWDPILASVAQQWTDLCDFSFDPNRSAKYQSAGGVVDQGLFVGATLAANTNVSATEATIVGQWTAEAANYTYGSFGDPTTCSTNSCSHYTQVVWANTTRVGCAKTFCPSLLGIGANFYACYYYVSGNFGGQLPYQTAAP